LMLPASAQTLPIPHGMSARRFPETPILAVTPQLYCNWRIAITVPICFELNPRIFGEV
jgi:hypothetical protein